MPGLPSMCVHGGEWDELACAFAVLDDAADAEGVVEGGDRVADVEAFAGGSLEVVDDHVVGLLERRARFKDERAKGVVALVVDAEDIFDRTGGVQLDVDGRDDLDVGELAEDLADANISGGGAGGDECAGGSGANDHVAADAFLLVAAGIEHAKHDGGDREDHDDLDRDGEGADDRAQGTMDEITEDELIHRADGSVHQQEVYANGAPPFLNK